MVKNVSLIDQNYDSIYIKLSTECFALNSLLMMLIFYHIHFSGNGKMPIIFHKCCMQCKNRCNAGRFLRKVGMLNLY